LEHEQDRKTICQGRPGQKYINIEKQLGYLVISNEGVLITAAHSFKRLRN